MKHQTNIKMQSYNISQEVLNKALSYMKEEGYLDDGHTVEDLLSMARSMGENDAPFVIYKINQWADAQK